MNVSVTETGDMVAAADKGARTVTFQANSATAMLGVATVADSVDETDSVVTATVTANPATYTVGTSSSATVTVTDDDTRGVTVSAPTLDVNEGSSGTYTVVLDSEPTASVTVTPTSGKQRRDRLVRPHVHDGELEHGADGDGDGGRTTATRWMTAPPSATPSAGGDYETVTASSITVTVDDDETADTTAPRVASIVRQTPTSSPTNADSLTWRVDLQRGGFDCGCGGFRGERDHRHAVGQRGLRGDGRVRCHRERGQTWPMSPPRSPCPLTRATAFRTRRAMR